MQNIDNSAIATAQGRDPEGGQVISGVRFSFRDEFDWADGELPNRYAVTPVAGGTVTKSSGQVVLATGTNINAVAAIQWQLPAKAPARFAVAALFSQANPANCDVHIELVDASGNIELSWAFPGGLTATQAQVRSFSSAGLAAAENSTSLTISSRTTASWFEIQCYPDEVRFAQRSTNSTNARTASAVRTLRIPDPDQPLYLRVRMVNGASAPASGTTLTVQAISIVDINEVPVDLTNTGDASLAASLPVQVINNPTLAASSNLIGDAALQLRGNATGAATIAKVLAAASTNATSVKATAGRIAGFWLSNTSAAFKYVKLFNKAAAPAVGTDVPVFTIPLPPNSCITGELPAGVGFATGIAYAITGAAADLDATAVAANDVIGALFYA